MKKRVLACLLTLVLLVALVPAAVSTARAEMFFINDYSFIYYLMSAGNGEPLLTYSEAELAQKFSDLQQKFPANSYWNHMVSQPYVDSYGSIIPEVYEAVTDHPCDGETYTCKGQCVGFAWMLADLIYMGRSTDDAYATPGYTPMDVDEVTGLLPGDIIAVHNETLGHEAIVYKVQGDTVYVAECWGSARSGCKINWGYFNGAKKNATLADIRELAGEEGLYIFRRPPTTEEQQTPPPAVTSEPTPAPAANTAYASTQTVNVDGEDVTFECYALKDADGNDTNYIKLRDLAMHLNGTAAQFAVGWDGDVTITTKTAYTPNGSELSTPFSGNRAYKDSDAATKVDGETVRLAAFVLNDDNGGGYTYYQLRDLGKAIGFNVGWSGDKGIFLETDKPYDPSN